jgi:hypothetical protein
MQSKLEKIGIEERKNEILKKTYSAENPYSATHENALSTGDAQGKGTGDGGHTHWLPDTNKIATTINYSNFNTENGGNVYDIESRDKAIASSRYKPDYQYGSHLIDSEENQRQGQFKI